MAPFSMDWRRIEIVDFIMKWKVFLKFISGKDKIILRFSYNLIMFLIRNEKI